MDTGIGVALGAALMVLAYGIQRFKVLPKLVRMRLVAVIALAGVAAAIVPSVLGTWARQGINWVIDWGADFAGQYDAGLATFVRVWVLPLAFLAAAVVWLGKLLPKAAARFTGEVATGEFDDDDNATVWGGALLIAVLWASAPGVLGDVVRTPIEGVVEAVGPAVASWLS